jgi:hypothetical protein
VDVAVVGPADGAKPSPPAVGGRRSAVGEAQWNDVLGVAYVDRPHHIRDPAAQAGRYDASGTQLLCFSGAGFHGKARMAAAEDPAVDLLDLGTSHGPG